MIITVFFTFNTSLEDWEKSGILDRELQLYKYINRKHNVNFNFITYGNINDIDLVKNLKFVRVFPIYLNNKRSTNKILSFLKSIFFLFKSYKIFKDSDIFKTNQINGSWLAFLASFLYNKPYILRCGYIWINFLYLSKSSLIKKIFVHYLTLISSGFANNIIVTNIKDKDYFIKNYKTKNSKITIIPNSIDINIFKPGDQRQTSDLLFIGRPTNQKNLFFLLKAIVNLKYELTVIGLNKYDNKIYEFIKKNNLKVNFIGVLDNHKLVNFYISHKIYIICSKFEGCPKTLLEAMACRSAIIGTNVEGINNIIVDGYNGILTNENIVDFRKKIIKLMNNENLRLKLSINGEKMINEEYNFDINSSKEFKLYKKILNL